DVANVRQQVDVARKKALEADGPTLAAAMFDGATVRARDAERHASAGEPLRALATFREAEKEFEEAAKTASALGEVRVTADERRTRMLEAKQQATRGGALSEEALARETAAETRYRAHAFREAAEEFSV